MSAIIKRSDQGKALRALVRTLRPYMKGVDRDKSQRLADGFPEVSVFLKGTAKQRDALIRAFDDANMAVAAMDGK